jgi:hypothetical protein
VLCGGGRLGLIPCFLVCQKWGEERWILVRVSRQREMEVLLQVEGKREGEGGGEEGRGGKRRGKDENHTNTRDILQRH